MKVTGRQLSRLMLVLAVAFSSLLFSGCSKVKDIEVESCSIKSFTPMGLRSAKARLSLTVNNPSIHFTLSDISGVLYYKGQEFIDYSAEPITIEARTTGVYPLDASASLADGVTLVKVLSLIKNYDLDDFTTSIQAKVRLKNGLAKTFRFKDIPISELVNKQ